MKKPVEQKKYLTIVDLCELAMKDNLLRHGDRTWSAEQGRFLHLLQWWGDKNEYTETAY